MAPSLPVFVGMPSLRYPAGAGPSGYGRERTSSLCREWRGQRLGINNHVRVVERIIIIIISFRPRFHLLVKFRVTKCIFPQYIAIFVK